MMKLVLSRRSLVVKRIEGTRPCFATRSVAKHGLVLFLALNLGCALKPTTGQSTREYSKSDLQIQAEKPLKIIEEMILIDARVPFEYRLAHVPNSYNLAWEDFTQDSGRSSGNLRGDVRDMAKRLALLGIGLSAPVLVIGKGAQGSGEEGRIAWMLYYLGVQNVQFVSIDYFKTKLTQQDSPPAQNVPDWIPQIRSSAVVGRTQFLKELFPKGHSRSKAIHVIDVRTPREYLQDKAMDLSAINIDWREFLNEEGRVNLKIAAKLKSVGIHESSPIYVVSNRGMRSSLATMALLTMGFKNVSNFAGGYWDLEEASRRKAKNR